MHKSNFQRPIDHMDGGLQNYLDRDHHHSDRQDLRFRVRTDFIRLPPRNVRTAPQPIGRDKSKAKILTFFTTHHIWTSQTSLARPKPFILACTCASLACTAPNEFGMFASLLSGQRISCCILHFAPCLPDAQHVRNFNDLLS